MIEGHGDDIYRYGELRCNFSSNISPLLDTADLREHLSKRLEVINHYPEPSPRSLELLIADEHGLDPSEVLVTSGATDAIYLIAHALRSEQTFTVRHPTFSEYADACRMYGFKEVPEGGAVGWLCNPNNPTGDITTIDSVESMSRHHRWLVIDQSYEDFTYCRMLTPREAIGLKNVIQIHSMTKRFGIPGLRLGYITAPASVTNRLFFNYRPWAVNALAVEAGLWLLTNKNPRQRENMAELLAKTITLFNSLSRINGISVYPTQTNFMLCSIQRASAAELKEYLLKNHQFLIRDASNFEGLSNSHFRIATQQSHYNDELVKAIETFTRMKNGEFFL